MSVSSVVAIAIGIISIIIALTPCPQGINPIPFTYTLTGANMSGIYEPNDLLTKGVKRIGTHLHGPETVNTTLMSVLVAALKHDLSTKHI
jgi:hypothetical protein